MDGGFAQLLVTGVPAGITAAITLALFIWHVRDCRENRRKQYDATHANSVVLARVVEAEEKVAAAVEKLVDKVASLGERVSALEAVSNVQILGEVKRLPSSGQS